MPPWQRQSKRDARDLAILNAESGSVKKVRPSLPHEIMQVRPIEQAFVVLRKSARKDREPEVEIAAVGQGGDQPSIRFEKRRHLLQHFHGIAQVLEDIS